MSDPADCGGSRGFGEHFQASTIQASRHPDARLPDTRQRILTIAGELFARQGYTATTIADIARELGTTTTALYYHFPSKSAILAGLLAGPIVAYSRWIDGLDSGAAGRRTCSARSSTSAPTPATWRRSSTATPRRSR